jgi:hypothetical protein
MTPATLIESAEERHGQDAARIFGVGIKRWEAWRDGREPIPPYVRRAILQSLR